MENLENFIPVSASETDLRECGRARESVYRKVFSRQPIDITLEQTINADVAKRLTGIIHFTNSISARQRWAKSHAIRAAIISHVYETAGLKKRPDIITQLEPHIIKRDSNQLRNFIKTFDKFMNPFDDSIDRNFIFNIATGKAASLQVENYLLTFEQSGSQLREEFIAQCSIDPQRFEKAITRVKICNFSANAVNNKAKVANQVYEIRLQRDIFARIVALSMDFNIDVEKILSYPITPIPLSLCHSDGTICKTEKSAITQVLQINTAANIPQIFDIVIIDGFFLLHLMKEIPNTFGNLSKKIISFMQKTPAKRFDIIFDQYFTPSIKDYERIQRGNVSSIDYNITGPEQTRPKDFNKELRNSKFKDALVRFLIEHWGTVEMAPFIGNSTIKLNYDVCYTFTSDGASVSKIVDEEMSCELQEAADTKIVYHVCKAVCENVLIKCSDTDILIIMLGNMDHLSYDELHIFMELGTGNNKRCIDINDLSEQLGPSLCQSLPGFHALTGCDYSAAFYRKGKKRLFQILKKSPEYQNAFIELGNINSIATKNHIFKMLEKFVCEMYNLRNINDVNSGRFSKFWETYKASNVNEAFQKHLKNFDASSLPPCKTELHQQLLRAQYIGNTWRNAYLKFPTCYLPESNGWVRNGEFLSFNWFDGNQFP